MNDAISRSDLFKKLMYVKTEAAKKRLEGHLSEDDEHNIVTAADLFAELVQISPALDVAPVVHAKWISDDLGDTRCSHCHTRISFCCCCDEDGDEWDDEIDETPWCMHCGARMDGEADA